MRAQRGFSLVEILAAFAVLTLVITISLAAFLERNRRLQQANEYIRAYQSLANEAELWRRLPYAAVRDANAFTSDVLILEPLEPFTTKIEVKSPKKGQKDVTLIIRWHEGQREAKLGLVRTDTGGTNLW
ncbi:MAG TPA: type II secretion system protein [Thermoanaerobaculia bacterium]|nr:type II secretion system protein [Thermoanaerobaculia bacterium]